MRMKKQQKKYITLNRINLNAGLTAWYQKELLLLVKLMIISYEKELLNLYKDSKEQIEKIRYAEDDIKDKKEMNIGSQARITLNKLNNAYSKYYDKKGKEKSESMVAKIEASLKKQFENSFYLFFAKLAEEKPEDKILKNFISQFSPEILSDKEKFIKAFSLNVKPYHTINEQLKRTIIMNNTELIKSIQQQYHREISQSIYNCVVNGRPYKELKEKLIECGAKTKRRAKLIAQDQINKAHNVLYLQELKQAGITKAKWVHLGGGKTDRKTHVTDAPKGLNGGIFDINKGMYDPAVKQFIKPGELPFCHCNAIAVVEI